MRSANGGRIDKDGLRKTYLPFSLLVREVNIQVCLQVLQQPKMDLNIPWRSIKEAMTVIHRV